MNRKIIVAHYNEDLSWLDMVEEEIIVYSKTNNKYNIIDGNKGQEVPMYLKYIIDNYNCLPDKTLFLHGHLDSPHQDNTSIFLIRNIDWELDSFFSVNKRDWYQEVSDVHQISSGSFREWLYTNWDIFQGQLQFPENGLFFYSGAQFVVNKELILRHDIDFYKNLYNWIQSTEIDNAITSRIFEYMWHYIFTTNPVEKIYKNILKK